MRTEKGKSIRILLSVGSLLALVGLAGRGRTDGGSAEPGFSGTADSAWEKDACGSEEPGFSGTADSAWEEDACGSEEPPLSGTIEIVGSSSMERLTNALAESFMDKHPEVTVTVQFTGSGAGLAAVAAGSADIGNASRYMESEEKERGVVENIVALDGIALCVDSGNRLSGLTHQQITDIFTGKINNWTCLNGMDLPIVTVGREAGSGTRSAFERQFGIEDQCTYANEVDSTGAVMARVASTPGAIGYVSTDLFFTENGFVPDDSFPKCGEIRESLRLLSLDGVEPDVQNMESDAYPLYRPFVMATRGEIRDQNRLVREWFAYVYSREGRSIIERAGLIVPE